MINNQRSKVFVKDDKSIKAKIVKDILLHLDLLEKIRTVSRILIKLNLCGATNHSPLSGANISVDHVEQLIKGLRDAGVNALIQLAESDSTGFCICTKKFEAQNFQDLCRRYTDVTLLDLSRCSSIVVNLNGYFFDKIEVPEPYITAPFLISFSKIKTHNICRVTGGIKNLLGALPIHDKSVYHPFLKDVLSDLLMLRRPDLTILDGNPAMEGDGPVRGNPIPLGLILWGNDVVSTDALMAEILGIPWQSVPYLRFSVRRKLGIADKEYIQILGDIPKEVFSLHKIPRTQQVFVQLGLQFQRMAYHFNCIGHMIHGIRGFDHLLRKSPKYIFKYFKGKRTIGN